MVRDLSEVIIPNGSRISEPGWTGFITTGPTTSAVAAWLASATAGGQRYMVHAFNHLERVALDWIAQPAAFRLRTRACCPAAVPPGEPGRPRAARQWAFEQRGVDVSEHGFLPECRPGCTLEQAHHTIQRSTGGWAWAGPGPGTSRDVQGRIDVAALREALIEDQRPAWCRSRWLGSRAPRTPERSTRSTTWLRWPATTPPGSMSTVRTA